MNRWRQSVVEIQTRKRQVNECERAQAALSKVTACFQQMATSLGSNIDGSFLREELEETRTVAHKICSGKTGQVKKKNKTSRTSTSKINFASSAEMLHFSFQYFFCTSAGHIELRYIQTVES